ncbi:MAG: LTA synthase family protein [Gammaproteobacteria bacterium]|nr:LTA synthase family protein [Gammaproteobacteria bacterium]MBL6998871.1 LTA synthase family protein [Gammaproteobacteria bacterium]
MNPAIRNSFNQVIVFTLLLLAALMLARVSSLAFFGSWQDLAQSSQFIDELLIKGLRFDLKLLSSMLLLLVWIPFVFSGWLIPQNLFATYLKIVFSLSLVLVVFIIFVDIGHLYYFQKPIDVLIFGLLEDDTEAIFSTILDNYKILLFFAAFLLTAVISLRFYLRQSTQLKVNAPVMSSFFGKFLLWCLSCVVLVVLARGSLDTFPLQRKQAAVSDNTFINSMVMNSVFNLYYAYRDKSVNNQAIFKQNILQFNQLPSLQVLMQKAGYSEAQALIRTTPENQQLAAVRPHVIFVLMEGWSSDIARAHSAGNNVLGEFAGHAAQDHFFTRFLANQYATNPSIETLLLNSPVTPLSQSIANKTRFRLSSTLPYKQNNYATQFLSGGYSSWRNHNNFWLLQGFDQYIGRSQIESHFKVDASDNPWGVYDQYVFDYLKKSLLEAEAGGKSLFSFVLTTNNHPPIRLPKSYRRPALDLTQYGLPPGQEDKLALLSGFHYQTDQLGRFLSWLKSSALKDKVIVVASGDHPQRTFIDNSANKDKYIRYAVPAYFYVPQSLGSLDGIDPLTPGSHTDLFPTLYELSLSQTSYYNFGQPFQQKKLESAYGLTASGEFLFADGIADSRNDRFYPWLDQQQLTLSSETSALSAHKKSLIEQEYYRDLLKKYLLVEDYQQQRKQVK